MYTTSVCESSFEPVRCPQTAAANLASELVHTFGSRVFTIARHITQNDTDAGNVLIETLLQICSERDEPEEEQDMWLRLVTIAVRAAFSAQRKRIVGPCLGPSVDASRNPVVRELSVWSDDFPQRLSKEQTTHVLEASLRGLDPMARTVFVLRDIEQISLERIARILNRSVAALDVCLMRARLQLREDLAPHLRLPQ